MRSGTRNLFPEEHRGIDKVDGVLIQGHGTVLLEGCRRDSLILQGRRKKGTGVPGMYQALSKNFYPIYQFLCQGHF